MAELRQDPLSKEWSVIVPERASRPRKEGRFKKRDNAAWEEFCPFCNGNERLTPPEVLAEREEGMPNDTGWLVRAFPNKYRTFDPQAKLNNAVFVPDGLNLQRQPATGDHEVLVLSPRHDQALAELGEEQIVRVMVAIRERVSSLLSRTEVKQVSVIFNQGAESGASLEHPHAQLFASPMLSPRTATELASFREFRESKGGCLLCHYLESEQKSGERIIFSDDDFILVSKWAARFPYELLLLPREHHGWWDAELKIEKTAKALLRTMRLIKDVLGDPPYNLLLKTAPPEANSVYHWHWEIVPRLTAIAGYEFISGTFLNTLTPEEAADTLRSSKLRKAH